MRNIKEGAFDYSLPKWAGRGQALPVKGGEEQGKQRRSPAARCLLLPCSARLPPLWPGKTQTKVTQPPRPAPSTQTHNSHPRLPS